jgi:hypothetical protein
MLEKPKIKSGYVKEKLKWGGGEGFNFFFASGEVD